VRSLEDARSAKQGKLFSKSKRSIELVRTSGAETLNSLQDLDKKDATILKGLAITAIVFHNFFHVIGPVHENEFSFEPGRFSIFLQNVVHPSTTIQSLFAFFGHFGVQIFIFLSAYGLAKSHWNDQSSWSSFMWSRITKLYPMFGMALLFWTFLAAMHEGFFSLIREAGLNILLTFTGIGTLVPNRGLPVVGPWWFIPFIMQFYAIWPLLVRLGKKYGWQGLVVLSIACFVASFFANPILAHWSINLGMTPIGRMRILCLGIIAARYPIRLNAYWGIPAFALVILGSESRFFSHTTSLAVTVLILCIYASLRPLLRRVRLFEQIGTYSLAIFLVNGIVRVPFVYFARSPLSQLCLAFSSAVVTFSISYFFHYLLRDEMESAVPVVSGLLLKECQQESAP